ncbi:MAG: sulfur oxidation c-type cytochrome SoxX [Burkholderiales bacterium]|nr:sulfur oxidation c-type cytochrome SoxX [Burkholderiales bacterium]
MPKSTKLMLAASIVGIMLSTTGYAQDKAAEKAKEPTGQDVALNNKKGNCMACHLIPGDPKVVTNANIAPPLIAMKARFPDKAKLRAQIWDATKVNSLSTMPPFGKHLILTEKEIDLVTDYVHGL